MAVQTRSCLNVSSVFQVVFQEMWFILALMGYLFSWTADVLTPLSILLPVDRHSLCLASKKIFTGPHLQSNEVKVTSQYLGNLELFFADEMSAVGAVEDPAVPQNIKNVSV